MDNKEHLKAIAAQIAEYELQAIKDNSIQEAMDKIEKTIESLSIEDIVELENILEKSFKNF